MTLRAEFGRPGADLVYLIGSSDSGILKIGHSNNPHKRLGGIQGGNPNKLEIFGLWYGGREFEQHLHRCFRVRRVRLEWFEFPDWQAAHLEIDTEAKKFGTHEWTELDALELYMESMTDEQSEIYEGAMAGDQECTEELECECFIVRAPDGTILTGSWESDAELARDAKATAAILAVLADDPCGVRAGVA